MKKAGAFTLIELLVVISIISLLASVVLASLNTARSRGRIAAGISFESSTYRTANPVLIWNFEDGVGSSTIDISGSGNVGAIVGSPSWNSDTYHAQSRYSLSFTGTDYVQLSKGLGISNTDFTFMEWIKTSSTNGQMYTIGNAGSGDGYRFGLSGGRIGFLIGNGALTETTCGSRSVNDNQWHHITGVFDRTNSKFNCYIDGTYEGTVTIAPYPNMQDGIGRVGKAVCCTSFVGLLDDVRVFDQTLTALHIKEIYAESKRKFDIAYTYK